MDLYIAQSEGKGRGVFAARPYRGGELIELCPVIVVPERMFLETTFLREYYFSWGDAAAICLGYGSLYNHSQDPTALYSKRFEESVIAFSALRHIGSGEEITIDYNRYHWGRALWFKQ